MSEEIILAAAESAAVKDLAKVAGVAYSGGEVRQGWSPVPLVIDLGGMATASQIPLLYDHNNEPEYRLGVISTAVVDNQLTVTGGVDTATERGKFIAETGKKYEWQLSIGAAITAAERVADGEKRTVNGREFAGPFLYVRESLLREVSVVAIGADPETHMSIAASLKLNNHSECAILTNSITQKEGTMENVEAKANTPVVEPVSTITASEVSDIVAKALEKHDAEMAIRAACGEFSGVAEMAISAGYSLEKVQNIVAGLRAQSEKLPACGPNVIIASTPNITAKALEAAVCMTAGIDSATVEASYDEQTLDTAEGMHGITLKGLLETSAKLEGKPVSLSFDNNTIRAAFSTVSLPGILSNVANKKALTQFKAADPIAPKICRAGDLNDFKQASRYRLTDAGDLQLVPDGGEIPHGGEIEDKAVTQLNTYGKQFVLTRQMIYNDDLGAFLAIPAAMGQRGARKIDQLFFANLLSNPTFTDGTALFATAHKNYLTGTTSALGLDSLKKARAKFLTATDSDGMPINVAPKYLLVPSCLETLAAELCYSNTVVGGSTVTPSWNAISRFGLEVVGSPYLENSNFTGYSSTGWYLFGDPAVVDTYEIGYLRGKRVPTVEQGEVDFSNLGIGFRVIFDLAVAPMGYQGMVFNKGVN